MTIIEIYSHMNFNFLSQNNFYMLCFNFILGLNIFFCLKLIIIYYHTPKQKNIKFKPRIKLNHNIYMIVL